MLTAGKIFEQIRNSLRTAFKTQFFKMEEVSQREYPGLSACLDSFQLLILHLCRCPDRYAETSRQVICLGYRAMGCIQNPEGLKRTFTLARFEIHHTAIRSLCISSDFWLVEGIHTTMYWNYLETFLKISNTWALSRPILSEFF